MYDEETRVYDVRADFSRPEYISVIHDCAS
jgi:hypothetical protein